MNYYNARKGGGGKAHGDTEKKRLKHVLYRDPHITVGEKMKGDWQDSRKGIL